jgi:hypothetical protein
VEGEATGAAAEGRQVRQRQQQGPVLSQPQLPQAQTRLQLSCCQHYYWEPGSEAQAPHSQLPLLLLVVLLLLLVLVLLLRVQLLVQEPCVRTTRATRLPSQPQ